MGGGTKSISVPAIIFRVNKDCEKLNTKQSVEFYHMVAKILFVANQTRPDICTVLSLPTMRVR